MDPHVPSQPNTAGQHGGGRAGGGQRIIPDACFRLAFPAAAEAHAAPAPTASSPTLFDVKTIHAGGGRTYLSATARTDRCGAVAQRARSVDTDYQRTRPATSTPNPPSAVRRHNGGSTTPPPFLVPSALL
eukprot:scaffold12262_cov121-Isochrysis_galbana.AAC.15